jgi:hypothetical protein|nr:MAG TPA: hypothetical protein [Caudoviricetes sp.]
MSKIVEDVPCDMCYPKIVEKRRRASQVSKISEDFHYGT